MAIQGRTPDRDPPPNSDETPEEIRMIVCKPGKEWTQNEANLVFEWLMKSEFDRCVQFARGITGDLDLAEEVVLKKYVDAKRYLRTYDPHRYRGKRCPFRNWFFCIIGRWANRRANQRRKKRESGLTENTAIAPQVDLDREIDRKRVLVWAEEHESRLTPRYREAVELCMADGMSRKEAASTAGCSVVAMKTRLHRAMKKLINFAQEGRMNAEANRRPPYRG
jgi:RNA polymerase sigma factor (sigma-70 family)